VASTDLNWFFKRFPYSTWRSQDEWDVKKFEADDYKELLAGAIVADGVGRKGELGARSYTANTNVSYEDGRYVDPRILHGNMLLYALGLKKLLKSSSSKDLPADLKRSLADRAVGAALLKEFPNTAEYLPPQLRDDTAFMLNWALRNDQAYFFASARLRQDPAFVKRAVRYQSKLLRQLPKKWKENREVVIEAMKSDPDALFYAGVELRSSPDFAAVVKERWPAAQKHLLKAAQ
jgi:hypothetical protein